MSWDVYVLCGTVSFIASTNGTPDSTISSARLVLEYKVIDKYNCMWYRKTFRVGTNYYVVNRGVIRELVL